ncbi:MAG: 6-bladed beta-propeller [Phycisphaerae bacterium]|nr:6-bladed beta-propeller [Phycisphaerae bacterium]MDW8262129.1 6-bladed beta-propeller [Phycisphaerales bacterium]
MLTAAMSGGCRDPDQPVAIWLSTGVGPAQVVYPRAIARDASRDEFIVIDRMARVQRIDRAGRFIAGWRMPDSALGKPVGVSIGPDGNIYVPDTHYHRVIVYAPDGTELRRWGRFGRGPGEFIFPTDVAFDSRGRVFVSEYGDHDRIQVFDRVGNFQFEFGSFGQGPGQFSRPQSIVIVGEEVFVADACNHRICVFTTEGKFVRNLGRAGSGPGEFRFPYGLDSDGRYLIVTEFGNNRVQKVDPLTGECLKTWGRPGRAPGELAYPWASAVVGPAEIVVVDAGNNRLQVVRW